MNIKEKFENKKIAVIGIGVSNMPTVRCLVKLGAYVTACDKNINLEFKDELNNLGVTCNLGDNYLNNLSNFDYIFRSPGVKPFLKELKEAKESGVIITSEIEQVIACSKGKVIGITGSDGKSTTTTLISMILKKAGYNVFKGGNIGIPLFDKIEDIAEDDIVVLELSSFQLMDIEYSPEISVITNISENHLDYHRSFEEYIYAKANIFKYGCNKLVLNNENLYTKDYLKLVDDLSNIDVNYFSSKNKVKGSYLKENSIMYNDIIICDRNDVKLLGIHNIENICASISAIYDLVNVDDIVSVITTFRGVEHRQEYIKTINGVDYYNDSIASSPARTIAGLKAFDRKVILIAGGYDKNISYDSIGKYIVDKVKLLILIGDTASNIKTSVLNEIKSNNIENNLDIVEFSTLKECVNYAYLNSGKGDVVTMSPASASFDMYKNFEERGKLFKELVNEL